MGLESVRRKVLVTGGSGLIGSRLVRALLEKGQRVRVLDLHEGLLQGEENPRLEFVGIGGDPLTGGMADRAVVKGAVEGVDVIYHLAINWDGHTWRHAIPIADRLEVNLRGAIDLLEEAKSQGVRHFLFSSSCAVYGQSSRLMADEETACEPETWMGDPGRAYGILKWTTERLCLLYCYEHGLPVTVFRIDYVFDDRQGLPTGKIEENLRRAEPIEVVDGDGYSGVHVDDVVQAFTQATLNRDAYAHVFNLSNPAAFVTYREVYELLIPATGSRSEVKLVADPTHPRRPLLSTEKIRRVLDWNPRKGRDELLRAIARSL